MVLMRSNSLAIAHEIILEVVSLPRALASMALPVVIKLEILTFNLQLKALKPMKLYCILSHKSSLL